MSSTFIRGTLPVLEGGVWGECDHLCPAICGDVCRCRPDATLREITDLVQDSNADARKPNIRMALSIVSETRDGR